MREQEQTRRPSRFEVIPAPDILKMQRQSVNDLTMSPNNGGSEHVSRTIRYIIVLQLFDTATSIVIIEIIDNASINSGYAIGEFIKNY